MNAAATGPLCDECDGESCSSHPGQVGSALTIGTGAVSYVVSGFLILLLLWGEHPGSSLGCAF